MMMNLFSSFDPSTSKYMMLNWSVLFFMIMFFPLVLFFKLYPSIYIFNSMNNFLFKEFKMIMSRSMVEGSMNIILAIFLMIIWSNTSGLIPYVFTSSSHLSITIMMALSIWLTFLLFRLFFHLKNFFAHLVPSGTPDMLMMFMVLIETVSLLIRPITLSVRLSANMIAGHLLLTLLGNSFFSINYSYFPILYLSQFLLLLLEMAVACIQAYVFTMLMILYSLEI